MGVFIPSFARSMVDNATVGAMFIIMVVWFLWHLLVTRPRDPQIQALKSAKQAARLNRWRKQTPKKAQRGGDASESMGDKASEGEKHDA
jgi:hypothetical protein